jgi:hypothetical protein
MQKILAIAFAVLAAASTSAHAELTLPSTAAIPAVQQTAAAQGAPQPAPATTILQTTNPQAQMVLKQLQAHGLVKAQPASPTTPASSATVVTLPASGQPAQVETTHVQTVQALPVQTQPVQAPVAQTQTVATQPTATAPVTPTAATSKPVVHATSHHETDEQKARRIAARYRIHW